MSDLLGNVQGADIFLIISLIIFLGVFIAAAIYMVTISKKTCDELSYLPLTENETNENE
ncbi:MAG: CcoQ/FixQ family Cbb3-type cytochrome c oxidase assembly chaperone [Flavobacteriales bacterium]|nr:CcoQ/FixQ family Cbb3-type cytochrome c oxidase assembly chaperone [Bacteroidota bacterium]MCB9240446.1 CcoQ/FixQ family Cbb3-type cytochrome c oxidase assembly chaperone [Flavobacteriales bacterium]